MWAFSSSIDLEVKSTQNAESSAHTDISAMRGGFCSLEILPIGISHGLVSIWEFEKWKKLASVF